MKNILMILLISIAMVACSKKKTEDDPNVFYTCSMDPQVMEKKPGKCPICKMELTKTVISPEQDKGSIKLSETQMKLGNIITQKVEMTSIGEGINMRGTIVQDERKTNAISSRVPGRVDKIYFKNDGEAINIGDKVYEIYSEQLQAAIKQYLLLKEKAAQLNNSAVNYDQMLRSAKDKLSVWGLGENQIANLNQNNTSNLVPFYSKVKGVVRKINIAEGDYVNEGSSILEVADLSSLWIEAEAYPQDLKVIKPGLKVNVTVDAFQNEVIEGKITFENPELKEQSRINIVRIEMSDKDEKYKPGMRVTVTAFLKETKAISIPEEAILFQPEMNTVWVVKDQGLFIPKMVETGVTSNGRVEIKSGLTEGEIIVISGAYLIDSEYRLRTGSGNMPGMNHGDGTGEDQKITTGHQH